MDALNRLLETILSGKHFMQIVSIAAIIISPVVAVLISMWAQNRNEKRNKQFGIFNILMSQRQEKANESIVGALNMIDVAFHDSDKVRALWHDYYYDMLGKEGHNKPTDWSHKNRLKLEMLTEIAKVLGYGEAITHLDVDRVYSPTALDRRAERQEEIEKELLRILKSVESIEVKLKSEKNEEQEKKQ